MTGRRTMWLARATACLVLASLVLGLISWLSTDPGLEAQTARLAVIAAAAGIYTLITTLERLERSSTNDR